MEEGREEEADLQENRGGIRYVTEELILRLSGQQVLALVRSLNLSPRNKDKPVKFIEKLGGCQRLQVLNLNHNIIQKIERLDALTHLRELQLAHNNIQKIEGLEHMSCLRNLNLSYNKIEHLPLWLGRKLHSLQTLNLQHNLIASLYEVSRLRSLSSLSELTISENPASSLPHSRLFLLYHLRTLDRLDSLPIAQEEREHAHQRFHTEELDRLQRELDSSQSELGRHQRDQQAAVTQLRHQMETNYTLTTQREQQLHTHSLLQEEIHTKNQLLKQKSVELMSACQRQYEMEQELTFYKIDTKFTPVPYRLQACEAHSEAQKEVLHQRLLSKAHVTAQLANRRQLLAMMSRKQQELEGRLDDMLSRIALETQEIKELEQQLTDGQILVNEVLQKDLEGIISGLQEYLRELREKASSLSLDQTQTQTQLRLDQTQTQTQLRLDQTQTQTQLRLDQTQTQTQLRLDQTQTQLRLDQTQTQTQLRLDQTQTQTQLRLDQTQTDRDSQNQLDQTRTQLDQTRTRLEPQEVQDRLEQLAEALTTGQDTYSLGPEDVLTSSLKELYRVIQQYVSDQTRTAWDQGRQAQDQLNQEHLTWLQAQLARQNQENQENQEDQEEQDRLRGELQRVRDRLRKSQTQLRQLQHTMRSAEDSRGAGLQHLRAELQCQGEELVQSSRKLQEVQEERDTLLTKLRSESSSQQNHSLEVEVQRLRRFISDSDQLTAKHLRQAANQLSALHATVDLLDRERDRNCVDERDSNFLQAEADCLTHNLEPERKHTHPLHQEHTHPLHQEHTHPLHQEHTHPLHQEHTHTLHQEHTHPLHQEHTHPLHQGHTHPLHQEHTHPLHPSVGSQGTQDSGLGLHYLSSPDRGRCGGRPPTGRGYWFYIPPTHTGTETGAGWRDSGGDSNADCSSSEGGIGEGRGGSPLSSPPPAPGLSAGLADSQAPLPAPAWLLCGSAAVIYSRPAEGAGPQHGGVQRGRCVCESIQTERLEEKRREERQKERRKERGKEERIKLRLEVKQLRHTLRKHSQQPDPAGQRSVLVCDEVKCVEQTLLKRRAELREADRLLLEAQRYTHCTREQQQLKVLEHRTQDSTTYLLEAKLHLRALQEEVKELRRKREEEKEAVLEWRRQREEEERTLKEVEEVMRTRDQEFQQLSKNIHIATDRLAGVQQKERGLLSACQNTQNLLDQNREKLDSISTQVEQQEEKLVQRREEEQVMLEKLEENSHRLQEVTEEAQRLKNRCKELCAQCVKQEELLRERRSAVLSLREEAQGEEANLDALRSELNTYRAELKQVLQQLLAEQQVLEVVKTQCTQSQQQLHRKQEELDRKQEELDRKQEELAVVLQQTESHRKEAGLCQGEAEQQRGQLQELQKEVERRREERSSLEAQCKQLEARRRHANRCLSAVEAELARLREEQSHAQLLKQEMVKDAAATEEQLHGMTSCPRGGEERRGGGVES
ncbi:uncharacterized protein cntrl [Polymixia lowei]